MRKDKHMRDNTKYSSYWLRGDLFENNDSHSTDKTERNHSNLLALASYKRAISNFVNIVTNDNIQVKFDERGESSFTDGKSVTISAKMNDTEFDPTVGLALHEGSHIKLTDFSSLDKIRNYDFPQPLTYDYLSQLEDKHQMSYYGVRNWVSGVVKDLLNVIEDRRIDYYIYSTSPGYKGYYHSMYDKYFNDKIIDKGLQSSEYRDNDWESYMFRIINITNENRDLDALPKLREVFNMIDLKNINRLKNTQQAFELACEIFKFIEDSLPSLQQQNQNQTQSGDGESDKNQSEESSGSGSGSGSGGDSSETTGTDNTEGPANDGKSKQDSTDGDDTNGDAEGDDVKSGRSSYNPNGAGGDGSNNQITDNEMETSESKVKLSEKEKKRLDTAITKQKKFQNGNVSKTKLSKSENQKIETLSKSGIDEKLVAKNYTPDHSYKINKPIPVTIIRNFTKSLATSNTINMLSSYSGYCETNQINVDKGIQIGTMLGKRLKVRSEERSLITPRMKNGKIAGRLLYELGMGNTQIFDQIVVNKHKPALIHISIDASYSMSGVKWNNSQTAAVAIAKAASITSNLDVVISYRGTQHNGGYTQPLMLIAYDSRKDKFSKIHQLFKYINAGGTTPEGLCFESILDDIIKTNKGVDSYFINFSDGMPGFSNHNIEYAGMGAITHTSNQIKKMKMAGITVLSYYISNGGLGYTLSNFQKMYGKSAEVIDVSSVIPLARTLNKMFE
jgi:hypothetical protein